MAIRITDGKITAAVELREWEGSGWSSDYALDFFSDGSLEFAEEKDTYTVENVADCLQKAHDAIDGSGDYHQLPLAGEWKLDVEIEGKDMTKYEITYDYCDECGNEDKGITEDFCGEWTELQEHIKQMRKMGCYSISVTAIGQ